MGTLFSKQNINKTTWQIEEILTPLILIFVLVSASAGILVPDFYQNVVVPRFATGITTADIISLVSVLVLVACMVLVHRGSQIAQLIWVLLLIYLGYTYALYSFDRMYTILYPLYLILFSLNCFAVTAILTRLDTHQLADHSNDMRLRRVTAIFLFFIGLILYIIELPIILERIPGGIENGGPPFMVMDICLVAPIAVLTGIWLWQQHPLGCRADRYLPDKGDHHNDQLSDRRLYRLVRGKITHSRGDHCIHGGVYSGLFFYLELLFSFQ